MTARTQNRFRSFLDMMSGARECAAAVEAGRKPSARALRSLNLPVDAFDDVKFGR